MLPPEVIEKIKADFPRVDVDAVINKIKTSGPQKINNPESLVRYRCKTDAHLYPKQEIAAITLKEVYRIMKQERPELAVNYVEQAARDQNKLDPETDPEGFLALCRKWKAHGVFSVEYWTQQREALARAIVEQEEDQKNKTLPPVEVKAKVSAIADKINWAPPAANDMSKPVSARFDHTKMKEADLIAFLEGFADTG